MAKWTVNITEEAAKVFESRALTTADKIVIQKWAELVRDRGPVALRSKSRSSLWRWFASRPITTTGGRNEELL